MGEVSVNINIAGRSYPITVTGEEESTVIAAGRMIQEKLQAYARDFSLRDNQDALAMFSLEIATEYQKLIGSEAAAGAGLDRQLSEINELLDKAQF